MYGARGMVSPVLSLLAEVGLGRVVSKAQLEHQNAPELRMDVCCSTAGASRTGHAADRKECRSERGDAGPGGEYNKR
jgi:hypothetical protein